MIDIPRTISDNEQKRKNREKADIPDWINP